MARSILTLNSSQFAMVSSIAHQCFKEGGHIVFTARMLYNLYEQKLFDENQLCTTPEERRIPKSFVSEKAISFSPNPAQNELHIQIHNSEIKRICLFSILGEKVFEQGLTHEQKTLTLDITSFPPGLYFCSGYDEKVIISSEKVIVSR